MKRSPPFKGNLTCLLLNRSIPLTFTPGNQSGHLFITLHQQQCQRTARKHILPLHQPRHLVNILFQQPAVADRQAAALPQPGNGRPDLVKSPFAGSGRSNHRHPQALLQQRQIKGEPQPLGLVHDIYHQHHRQPRLNQLHRHGQHPLQIAGIQHMQHHIRLLIQQNLAGNPLLLRNGMHRIHAGGINHLPRCALNNSVSP